MNTFKISNAFQAGLKAAGIDPAVVLRKSGLPLGQGMVTTGQFFALWRALGELSDDPAIGLKLPSLVPVDQHHPAGIAAHHARTFRDALQRFARYKILCCLEEVRLLEAKGECSLEFNWFLSQELLLPCCSMPASRRRSNWVDAAHKSRCIPFGSS